MPSDSSNTNGNNNRGNNDHLAPQRRRSPLLHMDLLLEVVSFLSIADLTTSINWASSSLWWACSKLKHWRNASRPRFIERIRLVPLEEEERKKWEGWMKRNRISKNSQNYNSQKFCEFENTSVTSASSAYLQSTACGLELLTRFADDDPNVECHRHVIPLLDYDIIAKQLRQSRLPRVPPPSTILGFGELDIILPDIFWSMEMGAFLLPIAHRLADHLLIFSREMTYAGCCKDTMPMGQLIDVFYEYGLGAVFLTIEPSRYEYCEGNERSDDLRQVLDQGPGLLTRQAMLRTPFVWIQLRPPGSLSSRSSHTRRRSLIDRIRRRRHQNQSSHVVVPVEAELFQSRFSAECHRWLNKPLPAHRQKNVPERVLRVDCLDCPVSIVDIEAFIRSIQKRFSTARSDDGESPMCWTIVFTVLVDAEEERETITRKKSKKEQKSMARPFPFRLQNENTGEALSLWHLTSPAPSVPLHVEKTEKGPEVKVSPPKTGNCQRSFVLRRHAHTGPLLPLNFVPAAIASVKEQFELSLNNQVKLRLHCRLSVVTLSSMGCGRNVSTTNDNR